jgi:uncharacterized phage-associated protein
LQKLLYYGQGWSLALLGRPLFPQPIEAWTNGPVVSDVYQVYKANGWQPIGPADDASPVVVSDAVASLVQMVWRRYAGFTPRELADMTHKEPAWLEARGSLGADARSNTHLSLETMKVTFLDRAKTLATRSRGVFFDPVTSWADEEAYERSGRHSTPAADTFDKLLAECR